MSLFNLSRWIARKMTDGSDKDIKVIIVGPPGSGKSKTALWLALSIRKWLSWYLYKDFDHGEEFFKMDSEHLAVILADDLFKMMTTFNENKYQVRIADDVANSKGFNSRTSMSHENLDSNAIWSTNRTRRGCTIVSLHDEDFQDKRQTVIADILIDLRDFTQSGRFRMARLYHLRMDRKRNNGSRKVKYCRFMTREPEGWTTIESLACEMPPVDVCRTYDALREAKDKENTLMIASKYKVVEQKAKIHNERSRCKFCHSIQLSEKKNGIKCLKCGKYQV